MENDDADDDNFHDAAVAVVAAAAVVGYSDTVFVAAVVDCTGEEERIGVAHYENDEEEGEVYGDDDGVVKVVNDL